MTQAAHQAYAGTVSRTIAYVLDALLISIFAGATAAAMGMVASVVGGTARDIAHAAVSAYVVVLPTVLALYCALFWTLAGRTPGMAALGLRVISADGRPVGWFAALVRAVVLAYFPVGAVLIVVDRRHQGLHDKIARTAVVR